MLPQKGYVYNKDYNVNAFSNALHSLVNQKAIASVDKEKKENYKVLSVSYDDKKNNENKEWYQWFLYENRTDTGFRETKYIWKKQTDIWRYFKTCGYIKNIRV